MSCQILPNQLNIPGNENLSNKFATLDTAFDKSEEMIEFQKKINGCGYNQNFINSPELSPNSSRQINIGKNQTDNINNNLKEILNTDTDSNNKMDKNIDEVIGSIYREKNCQPINRNAKLDIYKYGSPLIEGLNSPIQYAANVNTNNNGVDLFKLALLVLLIAALAYGGYYLYKNRKKMSLKTKLTN